MPYGSPPIHKNLGLGWAVTITTQATEVCPNCGSFVPALVNDTGWCPECSPDIPPVEIFLLRNADHIEHYMLRGLTVYQAIDKFRDEVRPTCACCGDLLQRARRGSIFCRKNDKCKQTVRKYQYLYTFKGHSKSQALAIVLSELNGSE